MPDGSWLPTDKNEKLEKFVEKVEMIKEKSKNDRFLKYIVELSLSLPEDLLSGKIDRREEAAEMFLKFIGETMQKK